MEKIAACLVSGRGGCDAQMTALAIGMGMVPIQVDRQISAMRPDLICCTGPERVLEAVALGRIMNRTVVGLGDPGRHANLLDVVLTTPQLPLPDASNVTRLDIALSAHRGREIPVTGVDVDAMKALPKPLGLLLVGGPAGPWDLTRGDLYAAITSMSSRCRSIVILTSRRTPADLRHALRIRQQDDLLVDSVGGHPIRLAVAMAAADEAVVTGDSVSMISECIQAGLPVGFRRLSASAGAVAAYLRQRGLNQSLTMPGRLDLFWDSLSEGGDDAVPVMRHVRDPLDVAVDAVTRAIAERGSELMATG